MCALDIGSAVVRGNVEPVGQQAAHDAAPATERRHDGRVRRHQRQRATPQHQDRRARQNKEIGRVETTVDKGKTKKVIMHKLRSIGKESGESVESVLKIKGRPLWEAFPEKEGLEVWF